MSEPRVPPGLVEAVASVASVDPELAERARSLGMRALEEADRIFTEGHVDQRQALLRVLLPAMLKKETAEEDEEKVELRAQMKALYKEAGLTE